MKTARNYKLICYFLIIVMCIPANVKYPELVSKGLKLLSYCGFMFSILIVLQCRLYRRKVMLPLFCWSIWAVAATLINGTKVLSAISWITPLISCAVLSFYLLEHDRKHFFINISWIFTMLLAVQAYSLLTHCFGLYFTQGHWVRYYFFGIRVRVNKIIPFAFFFGMIAAKEGGKLAKLSLILSTGFGLYFVLGERVSTSIVGYAVIAMVLVATKIIKSEHLVRNMTIFALLLSAAFVFFYSGSGEIAKWFFGDLLEEGVTLNKRTLIWSQAFDDMKGIHWIIGNGLYSDYSFTLGSSWEAGVTHNQYLETIFDFGFIGFAIYIWMCVKQIKRVYTKNLNYYNRVFYAVFLAIILMQIPATTFERPYYYIFYIASFFLLENSDAKDKIADHGMMTEQIKIKGIT